MKTTGPIRAKSTWLATTALLAGLCAPGLVMAQDVISRNNSTDTSEPTTVNEIVVTGSRIDRAGFSAPTPTTVIGETELRIGARGNIAEVLNDLPSIRPTTTPSTTVGNTTSGTFTVDLRGLGANRTLTLLNGRRFAGSIDLNSVPMSLVKRAEVVTGGASAAWGSGAVAGVVNIILDDEFSGGVLSATTGISSRGDGERHRINGAYGADFHNGRGHYMVSAEYVKDHGAFGRETRKRPSLDTSAVANPDGSLTLVNGLKARNYMPGGMITSGALAGQVFNPDGSLRPYDGVGARNQLDYLAVSAPFERYNLFGRTTYALTERATVWFDASYSMTQGDYPMFPEAVPGSAGTGLLIQADNAFLSQDIRNQLQASGETSFRMGRILADVGERGYLGIDYERETFEGSIGIDGSFDVMGKPWRYSAYYTHGEVKNPNAIHNERIAANFNRAIDAVDNGAGQIVCRDALTNPASACRPLNLFGVGNMSDEAIAYAFASGSGQTGGKLDAAGFSLRGDPFSTWAGPVSIAVGAETHRQTQYTRNIDAYSQVGALSPLNYALLDGRYDVKEGFAEIAVPLLNTSKVTLDVNGAARYSDYSTTGGIWSWKMGATSRVFDDLLLRVVSSRDIRAPNIGELFSTRTTYLATISDPLQNGQTYQVNLYAGGNPDLGPEVADTFSVGLTYTPRFLPGFSSSLDFYKIEIDDVIGTIGAQEILNQCRAGNASLCAAIQRDPPAPGQTTGLVNTIYSTALNFQTFDIQGVDMEFAYRVQPQAINGTLQFRALASYVEKLTFDAGTGPADRVGNVGDNLSFATPQWRGTGSVSYLSDELNVDLRMRYVDGGDFNRFMNITNNKVSSRTYVDLGVEMKVDERISVTANVNNLFDRQPPYVLQGTALYDSMGRYFQIGAKARF